MAAIKQIKVDGVTYDIKAKQDIDGNDITTTYVKKDGSKVLSTEDFTTELKNKLDGVADNANNYVHPSDAGNKHIPAGGSSGQILKWSAAGTATWGAEKSYSEATTGAAGLMSAADKTKLDGINKGVAVADATSGVGATAENIATQLNALLASLRNAGIIATE